MRVIYLMLISVALLFTQCEPLIELPTWYACYNPDCPDQEHTTEVCPNLVETANNGEPCCINQDVYSGTGVRFTNTGSSCCLIEIDNNWNKMATVEGGACAYISLEAGPHSYTIMDSYSAYCGSFTSVSGKTNIPFSLENGNTVQISK